MNRNIFALTKREQRVVIALLILLIAGALAQHERARKIEITPAPQQAQP